jgi:hypothetical protein
VTSYPGYRELKPWSLMESAYIAGVVDGEGCVSLVRSAGGRLPYPSLSVSNTHYGLMLYLTSHFGSTRPILRAAPRTNHKDCYQLAIERGRAVVVLRRIRPWLVVKAAQADLVFAYAEWFGSLKRHSAGRHGSLPWTVEERQHGQHFVDIIRGLNRRGPPPPKVAA